MNRRQLFILVAILASVGMGLFAYKALILKFPLQPDSQSKAWDIEARVRFQAGNGPVKVQLYIPRSSKDYAIVNEQFISRGYGMSIRRENVDRRVVWSVRRASGEQVLYYRATVRPANGEPPANKPAKAPAVPELRFEEAERLAAQAILTEVRARSADTESLLSELIKQLNVAGGAEGNDNIRLLLGGKRDTLHKLDVAVRILALAGIPARVTQGIRLQELMRHAVKLQWLEVYHAGRWQAYYLAGEQAAMQEDHLAWWHGTEPLITLTGGSRIQTQLSVGENKEPALLGATWREQLHRPLLHEFSLLSLPIEIQAVYHVLLTVPLGVFLLVILRNVIGIKTFGTFMPVLIALAFRETQLLWGIFLFSLIVGLGLSVRFYLDQLKLLLVPRLAVVLMVVILLMAAISIISVKLGMHRGLSIALFPMVILTMTIERMTIVWEERGAAEAMQQGLGSLLAAALAYQVMNIGIVQHLVFVFPELLLLLLAATLLLGRYSGYRLLEWWRFRALAKRDG